MALPAIAHNGDPAFARQAYRGEFMLKAGTLNAGAQSPFHVEISSPTLASELASFTWLRHLNAANNEIARAHARKLIGDWLKLGKSNQQHAWQPHIISQRLMAWLTAAPFFLQNASESFTDGFMKSAAAQLRFLAFAAHRTSNPSHRLEALTGLAVSSLCLDEDTRLLSKTIMRLEAEIDRQILADGGHISRSPAILLNVLEGFILLREMFNAREFVIPKSLLSAIDRMLPMLRFFQLGDHGLAYFHGTNEYLADEVRYILNQNPNIGQPLGHARHSGYHRLQLGKTTLVVDTGLPVLRSGHKNTHASCLAFEMSHDRNRIIVNCGAAADPSSSWYEAARSTAAHSTLTVEETDQNLAHSTSWWQNWLNAPQQHAQILSRRTKTVDHILIEAEHDGYLASFGMRHQRKLYLSAQGEDLRGEDLIRRINEGMFTNTSNRQSFAVRFHVHPDVKVTRAQNTQSILLLLPDRTGWTFTVAGAELDLAESVYLTGHKSPRRNQQIVLTGTVKKQTRIKWAFKRLDKTKNKKSPAKSNSQSMPLLDK